MPDALDPVARFLDVLDRSRAASPNAVGAGASATPDPTAMTLATADASGRPSARVVLLKAADAKGFVFYGNRESRKGRELAANPHAALCFFWPTLGEQVRVEGYVEHVSDEESDEYFASRPRESQIGAWASQQSRPVASREALLACVRETERRFAEMAVPRPPHWGGYRVVPERIEFWKEGAFRVHDRDVYERDGRGAWQMQKLFP